MVTTTFRSQFQRFGRWVVLGVAVVALTLAFAAPRVTGSSPSDVAWRGRVYRPVYYAPVAPVVTVVPVAPVVPVYRAPLRRTYYAAPVYGPVYYGAPYGGVVVTQYGGFYW